jgi:ABC-2 type transport system permease protein
VSAAPAVAPRPVAVLRVWLAQHRRALTWWSVGVALTALLLAVLYPSVRDSGDAFDEYMKQLPEAFRTIFGEDLTSPEGYLWSQLFSSMGPILYLVYAIGAGARAVAGEEEAGSLDLVLSTPVTRALVLRDKALGLALGTTWLTAVLFVVIAVAGPPFDMSVDTANLLIAHGMQLLLALGFGAIALAIGAATGSRPLALGVTAAFAVVSYLVWALSAGVDVLDPVLPLSPFRWFADPQPLSHGTDPVNVAVLAAIPVVAYAVAHATFVRRDIAT